MASRESKDGKILALFQNMENPGAALTYAWQHTLYTYEDGKAYFMTQEQMDHLNTLAVTTYDSEITPDGQMKTKPVAKKHRFSVRPVSRRELDNMNAEMGASLPV